MDVLGFGSWELGGLTTTGIAHLSEIKILNILEFCGNVFYEELPYDTKLSPVRQRKGWKSPPLDFITPLFNQY